MYKTTHASTICENPRSTAIRPEEPALSSNGWTVLLVAVCLVLPTWINLFPYWWGNPLYGCGMLVPALSAMLAWRYLAEPKSSVACPRWASSVAGAVLVAYVAAIPGFRIVQIANPDWRLADWAFALAAFAALLGLAFRAGGAATTRGALIPAAFLLVAVPWPAGVEHLVTHGGIPLTASASAELSWLMGIAAVSNGRTILSEIGPLSVAEACSGIRSVYLAFVASLFWGAWFRVGVRRTILLLLLALGWALFINVLRVVVLLGIAVKGKDITLVDEWHDVGAQVAQVILIVGVALGATLVDQFRSGSSRRTSPPRAQERRSVAVMPVSASLAVAALVWVGLSEVGARAWFRSREAASPAVTEYWGLNLPEDLAVRHEPISQAVRENYRYTEAQHLSWDEVEGARWDMQWLYFDRGAISNFGHNIHQPEVCLLSGDYRLERVLPDISVQTNGHALLLKHKRFSRAGETLHLFYTSVDASGADGSGTRPDWSRSARLRAAWDGIRSQQISLVHLQTTHPYADEVAGAKAGELIRRLLVRKQIGSEER